MSIGKIIGKIIIIPILVIIFICVCIYFLIKHRRDRKRERREDNLRAQYYRQQFQQQYMYPHTQMQPQQQQQQPGTPAPPYYNHAYAVGQQPVAMNEGEYGYSESMMKKPEPVDCLGFDGLIGVILVYLAVRWIRFYVT
ncbi:hypothetical protein CBS63078_4438 [Aspergillus niger]|nr:hypothetical protein CBS115989_6760 [Aspergillus niger]KAI2829054.1 hypothetical protein CBS133816_4834 [Aspergillus niger]KAI2846964.1 hypothetical protein CBS11350_3495 [Aspergillus niger]KAI2856842.1 hypothetical protein CBS11232_3558 [Aspergillus niger]KAI2877502.1 hypothetical protein CBS115988_3938 [Aspergillus niger]